MAETSQVSPSEDYPWYRLVTDGSLEQGDLLRGFPTLQLTSTYEETLRGDLAADVTDYDVIILTQSCDLSAKKIDNVLVCPFFTREELAKLSTSFADLSSKKWQDMVQRGYWEGLYLIPPCEIDEFGHPPLIVNFRQVVATPLEMVKGHVAATTTRVRLSPPYREHLSQAFARFIMRIGYPIDYPPRPV
jgi:hypothetical protein